MWAVMRDSPADKKVISWDFVRESNTLENIVFSAEKIGLLTTHKGAIVDPRSISMSPEHLKYFYDAMPAIKNVRPKTTVWQQLESSVDPIISQMLTGEIDDKEAMAKAVQVVEDLLAEAV
jgi:ABC-type glycerol-3-phosphate transport system substrate-binding protein